MDIADQVAAVEAELAGSREFRSLFDRYKEVRIQQLYTKLSDALLSERESDILRGRIAELKKIHESIQNSGG